PDGSPHACAWRVVRGARRDGDDRALAPPPVLRCYWCARVSVARARPDGSAPGAGAPGQRRPGCSHDARESPVTRCCRAGGVDSTRRGSVVTRKFHARDALLPTGWAADVTSEVAPAGVIRAVRVAEPLGDAEALAGPV